MRLLLAMIPVALLLAGCPLGCGFDGEGDQNFRRGNESMILCANGGFAQVLDDAIVEGRYAYENGETVGMVGGTETLAFTFAAPADDGWETMTLDKTDLDHAHLQCEDLESRAWWTAE